MDVRKAWYFFAVLILQAHLLAKAGDYEDDGLAQYETNDGGAHGKPAGDDWQVHQAFHGYLQLDGYGIDAATEFWEIKSATENKRRWRCGLLDCARPSGTFGDHAQMQLWVEGKGERAIIRQLDIF
jgi:hypothetical protein